MLMDEFKWLKDEDDSTYIGQGKPFACNGPINAKIYLYFGESWKLPVDAIVIGQNETFTERIDGNEAIFTLAGPTFDSALEDLERVLTGTADAVEAGNLGCNHVIVAVGPKYDKKFVDASVSALHSAYRSAFSVALEKKAKKLAVNCIYLHNKGYPRWDGAHVALRTIRRFLEQPAGGAGDRIEQVVLCVLTKEDLEIYSTLLPAYFPRNEAEEEEQVGLLPLGGTPEGVGNEWGAIVHEERVMRISAGFSRRRSNSNQKSQNGATAAVVSQLQQQTPSAPSAGSADTGKSDGSSAGSISAETPDVLPDPMDDPLGFASASGGKASSSAPVATGTPPPRPPPTASTSSTSARPPVLVPPIDPNSKYAQRTSTGDGKMPLTGWPMPKGMTAVVSEFTGRRNSSAQGGVPATTMESQRLLNQYAGWHAQLNRCYSKPDTKTPSLAAAAAIAATDTGEEEEHAALRTALAEVEGMDFITIAGKDLKGRQVVLLTAANLNVATTDLKSVCMHVMRVMEPLHCVPFSLVYCAAGVADETSPVVPWMNDVFALIGLRYKVNMQDQFLVHPSIWYRMHMWGGLPTLAAACWKNYNVVSHLLELDQYMVVRSLRIPESVKLYDKFHNPTEHAKVFGFYTVK